MFAFLCTQTGTLTSDELDLAGVVESKKSVFCESTPDPSTLPLDSPLVQAMATCHSLIRLKGKLTGNPLDVKLFEAIGWVSPLISNSFDILIKISKVAGMARFSKVA